jgi:hypothetical protein
MNEPPPMLPTAPQSQGIVLWHGSTVHVQARQVPRYLWTTTSIDVYLDGQCILESGGQLGPTGGCSAAFEHGCSLHNVELSWGLALWYSFPYELRIDGIPIAISHVRADNWYLRLMVGVFLGTIFGVVLFLLRLKIRRLFSL